MGHFNIGRDHQDKNSFVLICSDPSLQEEKIPHHFGELRPQDFPLVCPSMFLNKMTSKTICVIFISVHIILKMMQKAFSWLYNHMSHLVFWVCIFINYKLWKLNYFSLTCT